MKLYHTVLLSDRHKQLGFCEEGDFGSITLEQVSENDAPTICKIKDYNLNQTLKLYKNYYYVDQSVYDKMMIFPHKQGHLTPKTAIQLMIELRKKQNSFYGMMNISYILVGKRIYKKYCKKSDLAVTQTGNTLFGNWWTLDIEPIHVNKSHILFTKKNFEKTLNKTKKWIDGKNKGRKEKIHFSHPRLKWINEI